MMRVWTKKRVAAARERARRALLTFIAYTVGSEPWHVQKIVTFILVLIGITQIGVAAKYIADRIVYSKSKTGTSAVERFESSSLSNLTAKDAALDNEAALLAAAAVLGGAPSTPAMLWPTEIEKQTPSSMRPEPKPQTQNAQNPASSAQSRPRLPEHRGSHEIETRNRDTFVNRVFLAVEEVRRYFQTAWPKNYNQMLFCLVGLISFGLGFSRVLVLQDAPSLLRFLNGCVLVTFFLWELLKFLDASAPGAVTQGFGLIIIGISSILLVRGFNASYNLKEFIHNHRSRRLRLS
ncbi:MAG: hypothetical protein HY401_01895 [Elusimicrobia bacterium]|nr:hypothetical protein [Elusimicrobiota bacterium]